MAKVAFEIFCVRAEVRQNTPAILSRGSVKDINNHCTTSASMTRPAEAVTTDCGIGEFLAHMKYRSQTLDCNKALSLNGRLNGQQTLS